MDLYPDLNWVVIALYIIISFLLFLAVARHQELQADRLSAIKLGGGSLMAEALVQVFGMRPGPTGWGKICGLVMTHPEMAERVKRLGKL
jgi:Zn-dependent protease with chaperone function